jgi:type VI secretion system protein ImpA
MSSPEVVDFAKLLAPISAENPAGSDLRTDPSPVSDYYVIRDARKVASDTERRFDKGEDKDAENNKLPPPDWRPVLERARTVLAGKSKDLEIAAYLIEALVRLNGFPGLRDGFRVARESVERFWDGLYPRPKEDDTPETRFSHILYLNGIDSTGTLIVAIRKIPFTEQVGQGPFNLTHHQLAQSLNQITDSKVREKRVSDGAITLEAIRQAVAETPAKFYNDLVEDLNQSRQEFQRFCATLRDKSGYDPPSSELLGVLETYLDVVRDLARDKLAQAPAPVAAAPDGAAPAPAAGQAAPPVDPFVIRDRNDALDRLKKIADYFREHEPQSMIPFALDQAANWSRMSVPELLSELIPEESARKNLFKQVGIKPPETKKQ